MRTDPVPLVLQNRPVEQELLRHVNYIEDVKTQIDLRIISVDPLKRKKKI